MGGMVGESLTILFEPFLKFEQINMCRIQISIINIHTICTGFIFCLRIGQANKIICVTTITCIEFYKLFRNSTKAARDEPPSSKL